MPVDTAFQIPHSPIAALGTLTLLVAFAVCAYAGAAGVVGQRQGRPGLVASSVYASWAFTGLMCFASSLIVYAFLAHDFRIKYVAHYSDTSMPFFYQLTAYWGGLDGSMMFWVWVLSMFSAAALFFNRHRHHDMIGYVVATISAVALFFLALLLYSKNPFSTFLTTPPVEGKGLNPLLQNYWMVIHPPSLYTGYVGMTIPFAFCMAALASGRLDDAWLYSVRVWVIIPWFFLSLGLILGGLWAYEELGWGGYWAWDPVENAGLIPWFTATAFLHSTMIQERRGMLKVWNVMLMIVTFWLTIFGTFMTRSGVVQSVHAFGQDNELALLFLLFLSAIPVVAVGLLIHRLPALRSSHAFDSFISREFAFLLNNIILLFCAFFVLFGTMFPTLSEYILRERIDFGAPFFNRWMAPTGLALLFLTGAGPLLAWRHTTEKRLLNQFAIPLGVMVGAMGLLWLLVPKARVLSPIFSGKALFPVAIFCFGFVAFVGASLLQELIRGTEVRRRQSGSGAVTALIGLLVTKRRKYGGYMIHAGIAMMFFGFAGKLYQQEKSVTVQGPGETWKMGGYTFRYDDIQITGNENRDMFTAKITVMDEKNNVVATGTPARWHYLHGGQETTTEVHIDRNMSQDIYLVLNGFDPQTKQANFTVYLNPLVNFVWMGFGWLALGTGLCLLPAFLVEAIRPRRGGGAAAAALVVLLGAAAVARADEPAPKASRHIESVVREADDADVPPVARRLFGDLVCMCGDCNRQTIGECKCTFAHDERQRILALLAGKDLSTPAAEEAAYRDVVNVYITRFGGKHVLHVAPNEGFNVLAWTVPYAALGGAIVLIVLVVRSWVRRGRAQAARVPVVAAASSVNPYEEKLDDELDDID